MKKYLFYIKMLLLVIIIMLNFSLFSQTIFPITVTPTIACSNSLRLLNAVSGADTIFWYENIFDSIPLGYSMSGMNFPIYPNHNNAYFAGINQTQSHDTTYSYTGSIQYFTVPIGVSYLFLDISGAQGGSNYSDNRIGELGGRIQAVYPVTPGQILLVYVGEQPATCLGGWNGGGNGSCVMQSRGGGGASEIRTESESLSDRVIIARGGDGCYNWYGGSGVGGGLNFADSNASAIYIIPSYHSGHGQVKISWSYSRSFVAVNTTSLLQPSITISSDYNNVCLGTTVTYSATTTNQGSNPIFKWFVNDTLVSSGSSQYLYHPDNDDFVKCLLYSSEECITEDSVWSNEIQMTIQNNSGIDTVSIDSWWGTDFCEGAAIVIENVSMWIAGNWPPCSPYSINWYRDSILIDSSNHPSLSVVNAKLSDAGNYYCIISNAIKSDTSGIIHININSLPSIGVINVQVLDSLEVLVTYIGDTASTYIYNWNFSVGSIISGTGKGPYRIKYFDEAYRKISLSISNGNCSSPIFYSDEFKVSLFEDIHSVLQNLNNGSIKWGDYNNDSLLDVLAVGSGASHIYANNGNDSFAINATILPGLSYSSCAWSDFDNDNNLDFIICGFDGSQNITKLYRNLGNETFSEVSVGFPGVKNGDVLWLDYNNDGFMDLVLSGEDNNGKPLTKLFKNTKNGQFIEVSSNIINLKNSSIDAGDYNNDGYTDIIIQGNDSTNRFTKIYKNILGSFFDINASITPVNYGSVKWGDLDNDGKLDFVLSGLKSDPYSSSTNCIMYGPGSSLQFYHNYGNDNFSLSSEQTSYRAYGISSSTLGDYDNDGDLDLAISGTPGVGRCIASFGGDIDNILRMQISAPRIYRNDNNYIFTDIQVDIPRCSLEGSHDFCVYSEFTGYSISFGDYNNDQKLDILRSGNGGYGLYSSAIYKNLISVQNFAPFVPTGLTANWNGSEAIFSWNKASDDHTPIQDIFYKIYVRKSDNVYNVSKANFDYISDSSYSLKGLSPGIYHWSVRSRDGAYAMSSWAEENSFIVPNISIGICEGDTAFLYGHAYFQEGLYQDTLLNYLGNDSTVFIGIQFNTIPAVNLSIIGKTNVCQGESSVPYFINPMINAATYYWTMPNGLKDTTTSNSIIINYNDTATSGSIFVKVMNNCGDSITSVLPIIVNPMPIISMEKSATVCNGQYITIHANGANTYIWNTGFSVGPEYQGYGFLYIQPTVNTTYSVIGTSTAGCTSTASINVYVSDSIPPFTGTITGDTAVCKGETIIYSVAEIGNGTSYVWSLPDGATASSDSNSIEVYYGNNALSGNIIVRGVNACGSGDSSILAITLNPLVIANTTSTTVCEGSTITLTGSGSNGVVYTWDNAVIDGVPFYPDNSKTYTVTGTANNGCQNTASINITVNPVPTDNPIIGSSILCEGDNSNLYSTDRRRYHQLVYHPEPPFDGLVIDEQASGNYVWSYSGNTGFYFPLLPNPNYISFNSYVGSDSGILTMIESNPFTGCSRTNTIAITVNTLPANAGTITGKDSVFLGESNVVYTVPPISNASTYIWSLPDNTTGISSTNSIIVNFGSFFVSGNISVKGSNSCGDGLVSIKLIKSSPLPVAAGNISGSSIVCQGQNSVTYSVPTIANATYYIWTLPLGASGTSLTNTITVNYGISAISGNIIVKGNNSYGDGIESSLAITVQSLPANAGIISGPSSFHKGQNNVTYTIPFITNADSYIWTYSGYGATINGSGSTITINFSANATSGILTVKGHNSCGNGIISTDFPVNIYVPENDAGVTAIVSPNSFTLQNISIPIKLKIKNYGSSPLTTFTVAWKLNNTLKSITNITGNISSGSDTIITIANDTFSSGLNCIQAWTQNPNSISIDSMPSNDTASFCFTVTNPWAQLTGTKSIPGSYPSGYTTIKMAIDSLNAYGVGTGGVTFNIAAGHTETFASPTAGLITDTTGTAFNPIIFQKSGSGANPIITAGVGTTTNIDAIIKIAGGDYITFDGINLTESAANTTNTTRMEWGYALVKKRNTAPFNGCQNITIKNCAISLINTYTASVAIYAGNHIATATNALTITATTDALNNCKFFNNTISNVYVGIAITGFAATSNLTLYDSNNEIGVDGANTITNLGGGAAQVRGIFASNQKDLKVANNIINSSIAGLTTTGYGIFTSGGTSSNIDIYNNTITLTAKTGTFTSTLTAINNAMGSTAASNTVNIYNNTISNCNLSAATTGNFNGITNTGTAATVNIYGNTISGDTLAGSGSFTGIYNNANMGSNPLNFYSNTITNNAKTGGSGNMYCTQAIAATIDFYSNNIHDNSATGTTTFYGYYNIGAAVMVTYRNNTIYNLTHNGTGTLCAFKDSTSSGTKNIFGNTIYALSSGGNVSGLSFKIGAPANIYKNNIYNITTSGATTQAIGINYLGGSGNIYNNFISDIKATVTSNTIGVIGINLGGNTQNLYYNTIYLNASSSATTFGSAGIYKLATTIGDFRNNIIVNNSIAGSTGLTTAFRLSGAYNATYYAATSNSNCFYAGIPSASNIIFYDGTNANQTIADFKALVTPRDSASFIENPPFVNDTSAPYNLHLLSTLTEGCESGGIRITTPAITDDFDGNIRWGESGYTGDGIATDIGADEFEGIPIYTCTTPNPGSTVTSANNLCLGYSTTLSLQNLSLQTGISYQWKSSADGVTYTNILGATASTYIATLLNATYYKCDVSCKNGPVTSSSTPIQNFIYPLPSEAGTITGTPSLCKGSEGIAYSVPSINGASSYIWSYSGTGATISGTSNNITISFSSNSTSGILTVKGHNFCGDGIVSPDYTINISSLPENAGTITGFDTVCQGQNNIMYTVAKITNATSYIWTLPSGVTGLSSTDTIILNYGSTAVSGELTVCGNNTDCGNGASSSLAITINPLPESAASISGTATVYQGQSGATYSIPSINNANGYVWSVPSGASIVSGNNTNSITVNYSDTIVSGIINVYGRNDCGNGISSPNFAVSSCILPTAQATSFTSIAIADHSMTIGWTRGNGNSVLVIVRRDGAVNTNPENGIIYNADSVFGNGPQIGTGNYVVYNGTGTTIKISSLLSGTKYYFAIYEYNSASNCYLSPALTGMVITTGYCVTDLYTQGCNYDDYFSSFNIGSINQTGMICYSGTAGYNDFTYLSTSLVQGGVYPINGVTVYGSGENLRIWIDYNDDGYFDNTTEVCYSSPANFGTLSDNFILPISATPGIHRMRVRLVYNNIGFNACEHKEFGCINDYSVSIQMAQPPCSGIPNPGNTLSSLNTVCPTINFTLNLQHNVSATGISYQWQSSTDSIIWTDILGGTNTVLIISQAVSTYYRCSIACAFSQSIAFSNPVHITMNALNSCYCIPPSLYNQCSTWISNVTSSGGITNINNSSTCSSISYSDFSDSINISNLQSTITYLSFTSSGEKPLAFSVWIDFNDNGVFEPSERVIANNNPDGLLTIYDNFIVPISATPGTHRMRVRGGYYIFGAPTNPCNTDFHRDTEDYAFTVIEACTPPTIQASLFASSTLTNTISWTRGNGNAVLVVARQGNAVNTQAVNGTIYLANSNFGNGSEIGNGNYVVYNGTGTSVDLTALAPETTYHFAVYEYNSTAYCYNTSGLFGSMLTSVSNSSFTSAVSNDWENEANWDRGIPGPTTNASILATKLAIVNSNNYQCKNLTIAPLGKLTINAGKDLRIIDTLILQSNASGTASLIDNGTLHSSTNIVERYIPHTFTDEFHMLSSPVVSQTISPVFNEPDGFFVWNEPTGNWIEYADAANFIAANGGSNFIPAKGYAVSYPTATTKSFTGNLNTGTINIPLSVTAGLYSGWNFVANPYPSAINWNASSGWSRSVLENADPINHPNEKAIWVWNAQAANYGAFISNTDAATNGVSRNIALSQGFWVKAAIAGSLAMNNEVREHADQAFLKSSTTDEMIRLKVTSVGNTYSDELIISFDNSNAQGGAEKMFSIEASAPSIFSTKMNKKWSISNLTSIADNATITVGFKPGIDGNYTISALGVQALGNVMLEDLKTGTQQNLSINNNYSFNAQTSDNENRFLLHFTANDINNMVDKTPSIYYSNQTIFVFNPWMGNTMVNVFDVNGKLIQTFIAKEGNSNYPFNPSKGVYVIKLQNEQHVFIKKEVVY